MPASDATRLKSVQSRVEGILIRPESTGDDRHRRRYLAACILIFVPVGLFMAWEDFAAGRLLEAGLVLATVLPLVTSLVVIRFATDIRWGYRLVSSAVTVLLTTLLVLGAGEGYTFVWFYFFPAALYFLFGSREGTAWFVTSVAAVSVVFVAGIGWDYPDAVAARFILSYAIVGVLALGLQRSRERLFGQLRGEKEQLEQALVEVRTLSEMIPMCAWCGNVRDDEGYWSRIEAYLRQQTGARVSHSMCPSCESVIEDEVHGGTLAPGYAKEESAEG